MSPITWSEVLPALTRSGYSFPTFPTAGVVFTSTDTLMSAGDDHAVFPLASVTKLFTSWGALIAVDRGALTLDAPIIVEGLPEAVTFRELLSHAAGVPREAGGRARTPRAQRLYSNWGMEIVAQQVETATGASFSQWLEREVFSPLGLEHTELRGSAAWAGYSATADLQRFGRELLNPTLIGSELARQAFTPQFPDLAGRVPGYRTFSPCPWGLGLEVRGAKEHWLPAALSEATVGHFGVSGSYLWVDPMRGVGAAFLGEEPFGAWHKENWHRLNHAIAQMVDQHL